jgi:pilus assembly protein CpaE
MKGVIRVALVDPHEETRALLQRLLSGIGAVWLTEICSSYETAARSLVENSPELALVGIDANPEEAVAMIASVVRSKPNVVVLAASKVRDTEVILKAVRAGAREFLTLPIELEEFLAAIDRLIRPAADKNGEFEQAPQVITVMGAAGGVGCTTIAVNLAVTLAKNPNQSVILVDFDLLLGSIDTCLDIISSHTILDVAQNIDRLDLTLLKRSMTRHSSGLYLLPHPVSLEDAVRIDPESLKRMIKLLKAVFDTVVIDTSKGLQASDFVAVELADVILLVVQLDLICLRNSARLMHLLLHTGVPAEKIKVVVNREGASLSEISLKKAEETLNTTIHWQIPNAPKIISAARVRGVTIEDEGAGTRPHRAITDIARGFQVKAKPSAEKQKERKGLFAAFF